MQFDGVDTVKQVLAESPLLHHCTNIHIGSGDQADIYRNRTGSPQPGDLLLLYRSKQFGLHRHTQVPYFVQKQSPAGCHLHTPRLITAGIRKGPLFITEQFTFKKRFGNTSQVDTYKDLSITRRMMIQGTGNKILTCSVLPQDQDIGIRMT